MESVLQTYWWFLFIFVVFKCLLDFNKPDTFQYRNYILFLFSTIFFIFLLSYNIAYTKQDFICGTQNTSLAFYATLFPYVFIYVLGMLFISVFPGWLRSFSNTFGLTLIRFCGYQTTVEKFRGAIRSDGGEMHDGEPPNQANNQKQHFNNETMNGYSVDNVSLFTDDSRTTRNSQQTQQDSYSMAINNIYNDPDTFINELEFPDVMEITDEGTMDSEKWPQLNSILKNETDKEKKNEIARDLLGYIAMKDTIATYIWVGLLSTITILVGQNRLLGETCNADIVDDSKFQQYLATQLKE